MVGTSNESVPVAWPLKFYHCICWRALAQALRAVQPSFRRIGRWNQQKNMENSWRPNLKLQWIFYDILTSEKRNAWECTHTKHLSDLSKKIGRAIFWNVWHPYFWWLSQLTTESARIRTSNSASAFYCLGREPWLIQCHIPQLHWMAISGT